MKHEFDKNNECVNGCGWIRDLLIEIGKVRRYRYYHPVYGFWYKETECKKPE